MDPLDIFYDLELQKHHPFLCYPQVLEFDAALPQSGVG